MKRTTNSKKITKMTTREIAKKTAEFDEEFIADSFKKPSPDDRKRWTRAQRKRGRPRINKGAKVISVSIEKDLLLRADRLAKEKKITRASLIARGIRALLAAEGL